MPNPLDPNLTGDPKLPWWLPGAIIAAFTFFVFGVGISDHHAAGAAAVAVFLSAIAFFLLWTGWTRGRGTEPSRATARDR
ncbi:MAG TPA: hypothetical protein VHT75_00640 [Acidimicrobiales bacterium]|nr:hypothetical protein [Acidimicrobiales bacterium]